MGRSLVLTIFLPNHAFLRLRSELFVFDFGIC